MKTILLKKLSWTLLGATSILLLNSCGEGFVTENLSSINNSANSTDSTNTNSGNTNSGNTNSGSSGSVVFNRGPGQSCEDALLNVYKNTYHPFLVKNCNSCHVPGGSGSGAFAVADAASSLPIFSAKGVTLINSQSTGSHRPPYTGSHNQSTIAELSAYWDKAKTSYQDCVADSGAPVENTTPSKTTPLMVPSGLGDTFVALEWDLETQSSPKVPLVARIEVRKANLSGSIIGYEFKNPTLRLKSSAKTPYLMQGMNIHINNKLQSGVTTYSNIQVTINARADINFATGLGNATAVMTPKNDDVIALEYLNLKPTTGSIIATPTPTPTPAGTPIGKVTYVKLISAGGVILNRCNLCHSGARLTGLDLFSYEPARAAAAKIKARINDAAKPMPQKGLLPQNERDILNAWVDQGAPLN